MTSKWMMSAPAASTASTSSPRRAKSADRMEGAIQEVAITQVYAGSAGARNAPVTAASPGGWIEPIGSTRRAGNGAPGSLRQPGQGFAILLTGAGDDLRRQLRSRRLLVPVESLEIVTHELLVEARRAGAGAVRVGRPEAGGIGRERLIDQDERAALIDTELELGVGNDDAAAERMIRGEPIERNRGVANASCERRTDQLLDLRERDVLVVLSHGRLGRRSEDGRRQP